LFAATQAVAHHSFAAQYDEEHTSKLTGIVSKVGWSNPHAYISVDVRDADGKVTTWVVEMGPPYALQRVGWTRNTLKVGDTINFDVNLARDGSKTAGATGATLASGQRLGTR
jgi:hypothetical protein